MLLTFSLSTNKLSGHSDRLKMLLAGAQGFEPNDLTVLETAVLPLHQTPMMQNAGLEPTNASFLLPVLLLSYFCILGGLRISHIHTSRLSWPVLFSTFLRHFSLVDQTSDTRDRFQRINTGAGGHLLSAPTGEISWIWTNDLAHDFSMAYLPLKYYLACPTLNANRLLLTSGLRLWHYFILLRRGICCPHFLTGKTCFHQLQLASFKYEQYPYYDSSGLFLISILACAPFSYIAIRHGWYSFFISGITT